jgi:hypothetical protein
MNVSPHAIAAAVTCALPAFGDLVVSPVLGPALDLAAGVVTAGLAIHAVATIAKEAPATKTRTLLRAALEADAGPKRMLARTLLRVGCGLDGLSETLGQISAMPLVTSFIRRGIRAAVPGSDIVLRGARAGAGALEGYLFVRTLELEARRICGAPEVVLTDEALTRPRALPAMSCDAPAAA